MMGFLEYAFRRSILFQSQERVHGIMNERAHDWFSLQDGCSTTFLKFNRGLDEKNAPLARWLGD